MEISKSTTIEDLLRHYPASASYFSKLGIRIYLSGGPVWGTVESVAKDKNFSDVEIENIIKELNEKYRHRGKI